MRNTELKAFDMADKTWMNRAMRLEIRQRLGWILVRAIALGLVVGGGIVAWMKG